ncbi:diguanylate cyclase [Helicobacter apodemus]|uniref:Diguanylate cyclase n=1 Tax=Helicobacter apodemus TaxID=135569 RepID=A0A4U8UFU5_9HELI|nr:diguanylate cyclase [Helicobacter apodemus]TLE16419.1 diguanylate cyclase [Helicobacter apodemus]
MPNIKLIARETLRQLIENKIEPTPEAYEKEFYHQMKKMGIKKEEPIGLNRLLAMLKGDAKEIANKSFKNKDEFTIFLIKVLNLIYHYRTNFNTLLEMERIFLRLLSTHPDKEINTLAKGYLIEIDKINFQAKEVYKKRWVEQTQKNLEVKWNDFDKVLEFVGDFKIENDEFKNLQEKIKRYLEGSRDKEIGKNLLKKIETFFQEFAVPFPQRKEEQDLKLEQELNTKEAGVLEYADMDSLPINSITTLISKEGMQDILNFAEEEYRENKKNYSVVIFGIVSYHQALELYGSEALKRVLTILGKFLKKYSNTSDLIAYYGEEKFLACLLDRQKEQAITFIRKLDAEVRKSIFVYQQTRIPIKLSAQVAHRIEEESLEKMLKVVLEEFAKYEDTQGIIDEA